MSRKKRFRQRPNQSPGVLAYGGDGGWAEVFRAHNETDAGVSLTAQGSLKYAPVWQAVNVICGDMAMLPLHVYQRVGEDRQRYSTHRGDYLLNRRPNRMMNRHTFIKTIQAHVELWGNGYGWIFRDERARPDEIFPLFPDKTEPVVTGDRLFYETRIPDPMTGVESKHVIPAEDVLHIKGIGYDGIKGYSRFEYARNSFGLGVGQEKHGASMMKNGVRPSVVLETDQPLKREVAEDTQSRFQNAYGGSHNTGKVALLHSGLKVNSLSWSNTDAQWLESREFQRNDVASWFNLPPHKVGDLRRATFTNIEHQQIEYVQGSLMDRLMAWKHECDTKLRTEDEIESDSVYFDWLVEALMRGDAKSRMDVHVQQVTYGIATPNMICRRENLPGFGPDGDKRWMPANLQPIERALNPPEPAPTANPPGGFGGDPDDEPGAAVASVVRSRLDELMAIEIKRVCDRAQTPEKFTDWLPKFYEGWQRRLEDRIESMGGAAVLAAQHCQASLDILDRLTSTVTYKDFAAAVERTTAEWPSRAVALAELIVRKAA